MKPIRGVGGEVFAGQNKHTEQSGCVCSVREFFILCKLRCCRVATEPLTVEMKFLQIHNLHSLKLVASGFQNLQYITEDFYRMTNSGVGLSENANVGHFMNESPNT